MSSVRTGLGFGPTALSIAIETSPRELVALMQRAEDLGYDELWTAENNGGDGFSLLAAAAVTTHRIQLGTAITPVFGRAPSVIAMEAAAIQSLSDGRFRLGLGASTQVIAESWRGEPFEKPFARVSDYLTIIERLLKGERVTHHGSTVTIDGCRLQVKVSPPPPIYVGAFGPQMQ